MVRSPDAHVARLAAQPRALAVRARQVAAVPAQEHADVHLVLLALEPREEAADAGELAAVAVDDDLPLGVGHLAPRRVERHAEALGLFLQRRELGAVVRLGPRLHGALAQRLRLVRHDEVQVELDDVAEAVARRAGAERVVEREEPRLRVLVRDAALAALEPLAELVQRRLAAIRARPARARTPRRRPRDRRFQSSRSVAPRTSGSTWMRSTTTCSVGRPDERAASTSSMLIAWPSTSRRRNPRRARLSIVSRSADTAASRDACRCRLPAIGGVRRSRRRPVGWRGVSGTPRRACRTRRAGVCPSGSAARRRATRHRPSRGLTSSPQLPADTCARRAPRAGACSRESRSWCRRSSAGCGCCSSGGSRWPGRCPRSGRRRASPSARGTAARTPTATRRSGAGLRRRSCRRRATTCPTRSRP